MAADTSPDAQAVQQELWRRMGPEGRVRLADEMSEEARRITLSGIADQHPELSTAEQVRVLVQRMHGVDLPAERSSG